MAAPLTPREVAHIAQLARLELAPGEEEALARQLTDILAYAGMVSQVDTSSLTPVESVIDSEQAGTPLRADVPVAGVSRDDAMAAAPDRSSDAAFFRVPKVI
jgi:aspartyl-tRNA(Asn)/glutamyl-tRNA(Gln) amidotransferase subunit C